MRLAVLSDIHGNVRALDAVLADIDRRGVDGIANLGDCAYGPFDPRPVMRRLTDRGVSSVSGNEDRLLVEAARNGTDSRMAAFCVERLESEHIEWLARCPRTLYRDNILAFHGTPKDDATYLLTEVRGRRLAHRPTSEVEGLIEGWDARLFLCAHDHWPRMTPLPEGRLVVNPGSVGCPAYMDDRPSPHAVQNGSPHAHYALIDRQGSSLDVDLRAVAYDWATAADEARENGFSDWAQWLATGRIS